MRKHSDSSDISITTIDSLAMVTEVEIRKSVANISIHSQSIAPSIDINYDNENEANDTRKDKVMKCFTSIYKINHMLNLEYQ